MENTFDRLLSAAKELNPDVTGPKTLGELLGESSQTMTNWSKRGVPPGKVTAICRKLGISPEWLEHGEGDMIRHDLGPAMVAQSRPVLVIDNAEEVQHAVLAVPRYTLKASAGTGSPILELDTENEPNYCRGGWVKKNGYKKEDLISLVAVGDSMEPSIPNGASLIVHKQNEIINGRVHVICRGNECYVKRLFKQMDGSILVRSDNTDLYKDITISADDVDPLQIVGLVVSVMFNL